ncbi:LrgB family protein [Roseiterribacter gracilis]|uniref:Membrane protein n=1 Tax=Roseiterribacter gracilis TaxID=2812848 RepID=A0A8S8XCT1_9PROT|nr:membrane protein [Rhodospirillales bacterium TMPK1]
MSESFFHLWTYLAATPLLGLTLTLIAYMIGDAAYRASGRKPYVSPVLIAIIVLGTLLLATGTPYRTYFEGAQFVHFLLGPATVALGVPLWRNRHEVKRAALPILAGVAAGSITAVVSTVVIARALGASEQTVLSMAPKSVTTPIAMGIAEKLGGLPAIAAIMVLVTGVSGAMMGRYVLNAVGVRDWRARGLAVGTAAHGQGTAVALTANETAGVFASIALGLNGVLTALLVPLLLQLLR